jgi:hypothetical protein
MFDVITLNQVIEIGEKKIHFLSLGFHHRQTEKLKGFVLTQLQ